MNADTKPSYPDMMKVVDADGVAYFITPKTRTEEFIEKISAGRELHPEVRANLETVCLYLKTGDRARKLEDSLGLTVTPATEEEAHKETVKTRIFVTHEFVDGTIGEEFSVEWPGWTIDDAIKARVQRLRDAGSQFTREGNTIIVTSSNGHLLRETLRFEAVR